MLNEIVTQTHALVANTEQSFGILAAAHPNVEVIVNAGGDLAAVGSTWKLYDVTPAGAALVWQGKLVMPLDVPQRLTPPGGIQAGATLELRGVNVKATAAITTSLVGYDPECCDGSLIVNELEGDVTGPSNDNRVVNISGDTETHTVGLIGAQTWNWDPATPQPFGSFPYVTFDLGSIVDEAPAFHGGQGFTFITETVTSSDPAAGLKSGGYYRYYLGAGAQAAGAGPSYSLNAYEIYLGRGNTKRSFWIQGQGVATAADPRVILGLYANSTIAIGPTNGQAVINSGAADTARMVLNHESAAFAIAPLLGISAQPTPEVILGDNPEAPGTNQLLNSYCPKGFRTKTGSAANAGYEYGTAPAAAGSEVADRAGTGNPAYAAGDGSTYRRTDAGATPLSTFWVRVNGAWVGVA